MRTLYRIRTTAARSPLSHSLEAVLLGLLVVVLAAIPAAAIAAPVTLQNGTASFSQTCGHPTGSFSPDEAVDGNSTDAPTNGWTIAQGADLTQCTSATATTGETAVWETGTNLQAGGLTFTMYFNHGNPQHWVVSAFP